MTDRPADSEEGQSESSTADTATTPPTADGRPESDGGSTVTARTFVDEDVTGTGERLRQVLVVARREFRVVTRTHWTAGLAVLFGLFSLSVVGLAGSQVGTTRPGALFVTLAELSVYLVPLAALALGYDTVVGAAQRGTLDAVLALPVPRWVVLVGLFVGRALALVSGLVVGLSAGGALFAITAGPAVVGPYLQFTLGATAAGLAFLAVAVVLSTLMTETTRALGTALLAWVWFVFVHDLLALTLVVVADFPQQVLTLLVASNPAALLRLVVLSMVPTDGGGVSAALATTSLSLPVVSVALATWIGLPLVLAAVLLQRRY